MPSDLQIAQNSPLQPIQNIANSLGVPSDALYLYGSHIAKIDPARLPAATPGKLVLVTAINPTPAGEGKTTVSIGLADGLRCIGAHSVLALREPSMGPVFGMKGGATGGGYAQVGPMEDINLHFTGDMHAITSANNLLAALVDNHIMRGLSPLIDRVCWRRCLDVNDRQLRYIVDGLHAPINGRTREDGFDITPASEIMATFCLASDGNDLRERLSRLIVGYQRDGRPVTVGEIGGVGSLLVTLRQAMRPNLVQSLAGTPALVHGGPFANIAHGCNSVIATKTALQLGDIVVTEAGFGADLGAEKFLDIKCRQSGLRPSAVVIVATVRALKSHAGTAKDELSIPNATAVENGASNLLHHIETLRNTFGLSPIVAINRFATDSEDEIAAVQNAIRSTDALAIACNVWGQGGEGAIELATAVKKQVDSASPDTLRFTYPLDTSYVEKARAVAQKIYGADDIVLSPAAQRDLAEFDQMFPGLPICVAKTQYSLSDDAKRIGRPTGFTLHVRSAHISAGAGFVVLYTGDIITMPGLPVRPAALDIDIDEKGQTVGLF